MKIVILRHGKPNMKNYGNLSASEFGHWIHEYNLAGIDRSSNPPKKTIESLDDNAFVVCSHLPRSVESATILGFKDIGIQDSLFRECDMPYTHWRYPKLSVKTWAVIFRIFQLFGYSANTESFREVKKRADTCAEKLVQYANEHRSVLFVGHGSLNWLIHTRLLQRGWCGPKKSGRNYWNICVYKYDAT